MQLQLIEYCFKPKILLYDTVSLEYKIVKVKDIQDNNSIGAFVETQSYIVGLYASTEGPMLFWNNQIVSFSPEISIEIEEYQKFQYVTVKKNGKLLFKTYYEEDYFLDGLSLAPLEDRDFFIFLQSQLENVTFYLHYTLK